MGASGSSACGGASCCGAPPPPPMSCLERAKLLRHQLELARQRAHLRLDRVDSGGEAGGIADALARIAAGAFLRQRHVRPRLHQRFERGDHGLKIGDLLLEPADSVGWCRSCCAARAPALLPAVPVAVPLAAAPPAGRAPGLRPGGTEAALLPIHSPSAIGCAQSTSKRSRDVEPCQNFVWICGDYSRQ